jgi:nucleotide-binding universal stress UspA family protein
MPAAQQAGGQTTEQPAAETQARSHPPSGRVVLAYDGSPAAERALREAGRLLVERRALVLVVWKPGLAFELLELPAVPGLPPAPLDVRTALEIDESMHERARRLAQRGTQIAREAGFDADGLVVAEEPEVPVAETIVRIAQERTSPAIVLGETERGRLGEVFLGNTPRDVIRYAPCPVLVTRQAEAPAG